MVAAFATRSPFAPIQKRMNRSNESPMDFAYDSTSSSSNNPNANGGHWLLSSSEDRKRGRESETGMASDAEMKPAYTFGQKQEEPSSSSPSSDRQNLGGVFLFHQPLHPTHAGPDVEMDYATPPMARPIPASTTAEAASSSRKSQEAEGSARPKASSGAVVRVNRRRQFANKIRSVSNPLRGARRRQDEWEDEVEEEDEDEEEDEVERDHRVAQKARSRKRSLAKRVGDTLHVNYIIGGGAGSGSSDAKMGWLDPEWCLGMAQFIFNASLLLGVLFILLQVVLTLQHDISDKMREYEMDYLADVEGCSQAYHLNRCGTETAVPALASACAAWQRCSARDPAVIGRARVTAETMAEIVNGFVDVVSWKSMLFTLLSLVIVVGATNSTLSFFRLKSRKQKQDNKSAAHDHKDERGHPPLPPHATPALHHPMYNPYLYPYPTSAAAEAWHAPSPPATPLKKRMCR